MFVAMDKITDCGTMKAAKAMKAAQVTKTRDVQPKAPARDEIYIELNDHVTFCDKYNKFYGGIVKWIGTYKPTDEVVVGIKVVRDD